MRHLAHILLGLFLLGSIASCTPHKQAKNSRSYSHRAKHKKSKKTKDLTTYKCGKWKKRR